MKAARPALPGLVLRTMGMNQCSLIAFLSFHRLMRKPFGAALKMFHLRKSDDARLSQAGADPLMRGIDIGECLRDTSDRSRGPKPVPQIRYFIAPCSALAVALMIASEVIVARLVASTPFTDCLAMIRAGVSVSEA